MQLSRQVTASPSQLQVSILNSILKHSSNAIGLLPAIINIETGVTTLSNQLIIEALGEQDPDLQEEKIYKALQVYSKTAHTRKELKQSTGILHTDEDRSQPLLSIKNIQNILLEVHDQTEDLRNITPAD